MFCTVYLHYRSNMSSSYKICKTEKKRKGNNNPSCEPHLFRFRGLVHLSQDMHAHNAFLQNGAPPGDGSASL